MPLAGELISKIKDDPNKIRSFIQEYWTGVEVLRSVYQSLVNAGELTELKKLPDNEKDRLKDMMKRIGTGDTENQMKQVKAIYLIEQLTNQNVNL